MKSNSFKINYSFMINDRQEKTLNIVIDSITLTMLHQEQEKYPDWTRLQYMQCPCCILKKEQHPYCPAAVNMITVVDEFKDCLSSDSCLISCATPHRQFIKETDVMEAITNALILCLSSSACPFLSLLKPFIFDYSPLSSVECSLYNMASIWLLGQYFSEKQAGSIKINFEQLDLLIDGGSIIFEKLFCRTKGLAHFDGSANAFVKLHSYANLFRVEFSSKLESLDNIFESWSKGSHQLLIQKAKKINDKTK